MTLLNSVTFIWVITIIVLVGIGILVEIENTGYASLMFSVGLALILFNYHTIILSFLMAHVIMVLLFIIAYSFIGIIWSLIKWRSYVRNIFTKFKEMKDEFIREHKNIIGDNLEEFNRTIGYYFHTSISYHNTIDDTIDAITPIASRKKSTIISWITYWPISMISTFLNDPFRRFFEWIYSLVANYYSTMTDRYKSEILN